jgi:MFS family permease
VGGGLGGDYWRFWTASTVSNLGDGLRMVALPLLAVTLTRDPLLVAGVTALMFLPWLTIGPIAGAVVDRVDKRRLLIIVQLLRGLVAAGFAYAVATDEVTIWLLYATGLAIAVGETLADTAAQSAIPQLVGPSRLEAANGRLLGAQQVTNEVAGGPLGAGLFVLAAAAPFAADAATYLVAAVLLVLVRADLSAAPRATDAPATSFRSDVVEGLRYAFRHPLLLGLAVGAGLTNLGVGASVAILVLFVVEELGSSELAYGLLLAAAAVGGLLGAGLAGRVVQRIHRRTAVVLPMAIGAVSTLLLTLTTSAWQVAALLFTSGVTTALSNVVTQSLRQTIPPAYMLGRVVTASRLIGMGLAPVGAIAGGVLGRAVGLRAPFAFAGLSMLAAVWVLAVKLDRDSIDRVLAARSRTP